MWENILAWICQQFLMALLKRATDEANKTAAQVMQDKERNEVNDANVKAYEAAKDRFDRRKAALDLLNRESSGLPTP